MLINIIADTAIALAPHLKEVQLDAMTNGNEYVPILPNFKIYKMKISHGQEPKQVTTKVFRVKGVLYDTKHQRLQLCKSYMFL